MLVFSRILAAVLKRSTMRWCLHKIDESSKCDEHTYCHCQRRCSPAHILSFSSCLSTPCRSAARAVR
jgi:hypothetical protein